jgi:hypothetical protein
LRQNSGLCHGHSTNSVWFTEIGNCRKYFFLRLAWSVKEMSARSNAVHNKPSSKFDSKIFSYEAISIGHLLVNSAAQVVEKTQESFGVIFAVACDAPLFLYATILA